MLTITLPDSSVRQFEQAVTILQLAESIGAGLAKATLAGIVDGQLFDVGHLIEKNAKVTLVTSRDAAGLDIIRHSTAHLLAHAVKQLYPQAQVTIGPVIEDGFYYDFSCDTPFSEGDLEKISERMQALVKQKIPVERFELSRDEAISFFEKQGEHYKADIVRDIPQNEILSLYRQADFTDLCRGPHVPNTSFLGSFALTKVAGAYWRGDSNNEMLQRVYGTAWANKKDLKSYLHRVEEAKRRDHRLLAKKMDLYHMQEEAPGMVFWHQAGWSIYSTIVNYLTKQYRQAGYQEINTPQLVDMSLWEKSGHADKFGDDMFSLTTGIESGERRYAIKPMNCPCHVQVYNQGLRSYRDLPLRLAEFGSCHRNEPSGTLHGLMRVRNFVQDDGHIFCTETQIQAEIGLFIDQLKSIYQQFGFEDILVKLSTRPEKRVGDDVVWDKAESALEKALDDKEIDWDLLPGEGAFYGPKIEFSLKDCLGRIWQCGTVQVDFSMPERLGATYIDEAGEKQVPVMLHRATVGSIERFIGILLEEYEGNLPLWLAPTQIAVLNITERQQDYMLNVAKQLTNEGFRVISDARNEKIGFKIREHTVKRVPYLLVLGDKESSENTVTVRSQSGEQLGVMPVQSFVDLLNSKVNIGVKY